MSEELTIVENEYHCPRCKKKCNNWSMTYDGMPTKELCWQCWSKFLEENFGSLTPTK